MKITKETVEQILQVAENFQNDCHNMANQILNEKKVSYQDAVNVWTFKKLAEFELRLSQLENHHSY
jgi:hypothetical protein